MYITGCTYTICLMLKYSQVNDPFHRRVSSQLTLLWKKDRDRDISPFATTNPVSGKSYIHSNYPRIHPKFNKFIRINLDRFFTNFTDSIIVTLNYRVGVLGFLRNPLYGIHGNMGFRDQRMAMQWVKDYISYFGGDGKKTLFGQSSGAISVAAHVASPLSKGLFDNVIIESEPWTIPLRTTANADLLGEQFILVSNFTHVKPLCITKIQNWQE